MGKARHNIAASDISVDGRRKSVREEQKIRKKKKRRKKDLTDLHQRVFKSKKDKETKINGKSNKAPNSRRLSNRILPGPLAGIYRNGATGKEIRRFQTKAALNDLNNARLQGDVLKLMDGYDSKSEDVVVENGNIEVQKELLLDSTIKNILQPTPPGVQSSPILGKVDGRRRIKSEGLIEFPQKPAEKKKTIDSENLRNFALSKYEELCRVVCSENFEEENFPDCFGPDPLTKVKQKLRNIYAKSFQNKCLRDMIKRGNILNECGTPSTSMDDSFPPDTAYCPSGYPQDANLVSETIDNSDWHIDIKSNKDDDSLQERQNLFLIPKTNLKKNEINTSNLLFHSSSLNTLDAGIKNSLEPEMSHEMNNISNEDESTDVSNRTSLEINYSTSSTHKNSIMKYFEINEFDCERIKDKNKPLLFAQTEAESQNSSIDKKRLIKHKTQRRQTVHFLNNGLKKHAERQNFKIMQQVKMKNLKHIPAILRRCNNVVANNNNRLNLFQEPMHINKESRKMLFDVAPKQNVLFTSQSVVTESNEDSKRPQKSKTANTFFDSTKMKDLNVQTCVIDSPSIFEHNQTQQNLHANDILVNRTNPPIQKTVMFTKKDSRNIGHCLYINNIIADGKTDKSNVCIIRKNVPLQHERSKNNCTVYKHYQEAPGNYYKAYRCSENSDSSNYNSQEFKEASAPEVQHVQIHQKPMVCENGLVRKVMQPSKSENGKKYHNDQHVCYVVVDQCNDVNNMQEYSYNNVPEIEKPRAVQNGRFCQEDIADVGILKGVQNLKILPMEEQEPQIQVVNNQCIKNAVILEKQPIKYLAFENDSKTEKIPIYMQRNKHVASVDNIELINSGANYRVVSYPQESTQKVIFVPTCEQNKVVYVKQQNLPHSNVTFEECSHPRKVVMCRPEVQYVKESSNVCEVHLPKQNVVEIGKSDCDTIVTNLQKAKNMKSSRRGGVNREGLHYRPNHEYDACVRNQAIFYQK
ncbi:uncharacterized protein [Bombus flavifrons]|uniref:uncharacterized protein isoform X1 n=1 Tax=Bombus flavifrons TaxID=103934 RepID=UPI0037037D4C